MDLSFQKKFNQLSEYIKKFGSVAVAYSGGVDSTLLLKAALITLGIENVIAITARSPLIPVREVNSSIEFCKKEGIKHVIVDFKPLEVEGFCQNKKERCYICKKALLTDFIATADRNHISTLLEGSNTDDLSDYRPGLKAVKELGIVSPFQAVGLTKNDIRVISKELGLSTYNKPSFACLASRFAYGEPIDEQRLKMVESAEQVLFELGFQQYRVRVHGSVARIEVNNDDLPRVVENRSLISKKLTEYGFKYVTLDLNGYRSGSMNEIF